MKRLLLILSAFVFVVPSMAPGAVNVKNSGVKKAASVKMQETAPAESATSLLPTVIGLVGSVKNLNAQQQQLTADCAPTEEEVRIVNDLVKEWAKIGETNAKGAASGLGVLCNPNNNSLETRTDDGTYKSYMELAEKNEVCYERFAGSANAGAIWFGFPKASRADICDVNNPKNCTKVSNLYDVFAKVSFTK